MTILIAANLSRRADTVVRAGIGLAASLGESVLTIHAVSPEALEEMRHEMPPEGRYDDVIFDRLQADLRALVERVRPGADVDVEVRIVRGEAGEAILRHSAEGDCTYAVIGVRSRSRVGKLVFGSTAQQVLLGATRPIVAVPSDLNT